jgi:hypothetical protein
MNVRERPRCPPLWLLKGWISDGREALKFNPIHDDHWSQ